MTVPPLYHLARGQTPLLVSVPHAGTYVPPDIAAQLNDAGRAVTDTDWHVDRLVAFATEMHATLLVATHSRTVVDLNRSPDGALLYPGQIETGLCPIESFAGEPLYARQPPDREEINTRTKRYWQPYHDALQSEILRLQARHGYVRLIDMHSIASRVPRLFSGRLPDLNVGTNDGAAAGADFTSAVMGAVARYPEFSAVLNGRFKGGAITRTYGQPARHVEAVQIEIAQGAYMDEATPGIYDERRAAPLVAALREVFLSC